MSTTAEAQPELLSPELVEEAARQFNICNACRYCEGLCAVFPALERRLTFKEADVVLLANLCHDCRACFDACPYATPHVYEVDIPPLMSQIREETYESCTVPARFSGLSESWVNAILALAAVLVIVVATWVGVGSEVFYGVHEGPGAFYAIVPFLAMTFPALAIVGLGIMAMYLGARRFGRIVAGSEVETHDRNVRRTLLDVLLFRNMDGGGPGCNYPREPLSQGRRVGHSLMFYGFGAALASTTLAAIYQDIFGIYPPYPVMSAPVLLGIAGGVMMVVASGSMIAQKRASREELETPKMKSMDMTFIFLLLAINLTGLALLVLRVTSLMGFLLTVHLGLVLALFVTLPYGKFVHGIYRTMALYRNAAED